VGTAGPLARAPATRTANTDWRLSPAST